MRTVCAAVSYTHLDVYKRQGLDSVSYAILVAVVVLVLGLPPLVLYGMRKPGWDLRSDAERNTDTYDVLVNPEY